tara:strand:- start:9936 stop:10802 length:867 start_codon:yes stop_codon:yes gene_type:complete
MEGIYNRTDAREYYLNLAKDWIDPNPAPVVISHDGVRVVRDDMLVGSKVRGGDCLISTLPESIDTIVYCQPRFGLAGVSLLDVAKRHGKKVKLFMPASKQISHHQAACIERGAEAEFLRIAAMPNLNLAAKKWADQHDNAFFVPLGLKHELVTAGFVKVASTIPEPDDVWTVLSTGVLHRSLQIAWPNAKFHGVAVARNMKAGEVGHDRIISHPLQFTQPVKQEDMPPFPCIAEYDAKGWKPAVEYAKANPTRDVLFWNVGNEPELTDESLYETINSNRAWIKKDITL